MVIEIPKRLKEYNLNYVLIGEGKRPFELDWTNKIHRYNDSVLQQQLNWGKNYGVQGNNSTIIINNESRFLVIIDIDKKEFQDIILDKFPETFTTTSGSSKNCYHLWFASDNNKSFKILDENKETLCDILGAGKQVIAPGSKHDSGSIYSIVKDLPIVFIPYTEIEAILKPYDKNSENILIKEKTTIKNNTLLNLTTNDIINSIPMLTILKILNIDTTKNPTKCPLHDSIGGRCLSWSNDVLHCFHCDGNWNKFSFVREVLKLDDKQTFDWFAEKTGRKEEMIKVRIEYMKQKDITDIKKAIDSLNIGSYTEKEIETILTLISRVSILTQENLLNELSKKTNIKTSTLTKATKEIYKNNKIINKTESNNLTQNTIDLDIFGRWGQAKSFYDRQPYYYDSNKKIFWIWNKDKYCYVQTNEVELLNKLNDLIGVGIIEAKARTEIITVLKQFGDKMKPKDIKPTWIQYLDTIYDISDGSNFKASPKYFVLNPIPHKIGVSEETPIIDKLFKSWVKESKVDLLYQMFAFCTIPNYFIHSIFFLYGPPGTAKSTTVRLLRYFVGEENVYASSFARLQSNPRFETFNWYGKLMIEIAENNQQNFSNTEEINKGSGEDLITAEKKGGGIFQFYNYGKFIIYTNLAPKISKDDGFNRRVRVIKYIHQFDKEKNILALIPEVEFENLAKKSLRIAQELYESCEFIKGETISQRTEEYQEISKSIVEKFIEQKCDVDDVSNSVGFDTFFAEFSKFCNFSGERPLSKIELSRELKRLQWDKKILSSKDVNGNWTTKTCILGLNLKKLDSKIL